MKMRHKEKKQQEKDDVSEEPKKVVSKPSFLRSLFGTATETRDDDDEDDDDSSADDEDDDEESNSSWDGSESASGASSTDDSKNSELGLQAFDRQLRAKHAQACRAMTGGKYAKAVTGFEAILAQLLKRYGESHHRVGAALHNVAIANLRAGQLDEAIDAIEEAVRIRKVTLGRDSPKVADSLVEYGIILLSMKEYSDSLEIFQEALEMRRKEAADMIAPHDIRECKLKVAKVMNNIGCVNYEKSNHDEARNSFEEAIKMQKDAFGSWNPFTRATDVTKPGFLTMASTMCNKGYIDLEQGKYKMAIGTFSESLKIQKALLGANNRLVLTTLDNLGFANVMMGDYDGALRAYKELLSIQRESYGDAEKGIEESIRKVIFCQLKGANFDGAFENLEALEDVYGEDPKKYSKGLKETRKLMGQVNYEIFKHPSLAETAHRAFGCSPFTNDFLEMSDYWFPKKPINGSKMSGHRITYA